MSTNLDAFKKKLADFTVVVVPDRGADFQRALAFRGHRGVTEKTPVDRGPTRASWLVGDNTVPTGTAEAGEDLESTLARGRAVINGIKFFTKTSIVNNKVNAEIIENGGFVPPDPVDSPEANARRSKLRKAFGRRDDNEGKPKVKGGYSIQAPQGMLAVTFEELVQFAQRAARLPETGGAS